MNNPHQARISAAIANTQRLLPGYFEKTLASRIEGPSALGSRYRYTADDLIASLYGRDVAPQDTHLWWRELHHETIAPGCTAFCRPLDGYSGVVELDALPSGALVRLSDPKGTGFVEAVYGGGIGQLETHTTIILGPHEGEVVYTFHPGFPIAPSRVKGEDGAVIYGWHARKLGLTHAKIEHLEVGNIGR